MERGRSRAKEGDDQPARLRMSCISLRPLLQRLDFRQRCSKILVPRCGFACPRRALRPPFLDGDLAAGAGGLSMAKPSNNPSFYGQPGNNRPCKARRLRTFTEG